MESIEIKDFLTIDYAHFEIKKINILIGEQAQGKSIIAKLIYFFKDFFPDIFIPSIENFETKKEIDKKCLAQFEQIFPRYSWNHQDFLITYTYQDYNVLLSGNKKNKHILKLTLDKKLINLHNKLKKGYKNSLDKLNFHEKSSKSSHKDILRNSIFIPAGRSFFANLQNNIFSFLANNIDIDPLIKKFGYYYEVSKLNYSKDFFYKNEYIKEKSIVKKLNTLTVDIMNGEYVYEKNQDWILNKGKKTNLMNTSSGQQESLPMLLILKFLPFSYEKENAANFFIEEPEAHLFPTSQKKIISLIATIYNTEFCNSFFITTHSPYILTAINNLVVGKDAYDKANGDVEQLKRLEKVFAFDELISLEDVSAYTLNKGKLESIIDRENRLIGANLLDAVSDEFDNAFGVAAEILYGAD